MISKHSQDADGHHKEDLQPDDHVAAWAGVVRAGILLVNRGLGFAAPCASGPLLQPSLPRPEWW